MAHLPAPVVAYQHGILPRSEALVAATRDLERGRTTPEAVEEAFRSDTEAAVAVQREAGVDFVSDGLLRWQDLFRPLVDAARGLEARGLVRWFDNNAFFRAPQVDGAPVLEADLPGWVGDGLADEEGKVATLPSPLLFSRAVLADGSRDALMDVLAREVLRPAAATLVARGCGIVHLEEPWLGFFGIDEASWDHVEHALGAIREVTDGRALLVLHTYYGDVARHAARLVRLPVDAVGVDFVETDVDALPRPWGTGLLVGCVDGRRSVVESEEGTAAFVQRVAETLEPEALLISSGSNLEFLPRQRADAKVAVLGSVARRLREEVG